VLGSGVPLAINVVVAEIPPLARQDRSVAAALTSPTAATTCTRSARWLRSSPEPSAASWSGRTAPAFSLARCPTRWRSS